MSRYPIIPAKTGMVFFDALNAYLRPDDPQARAAIDKLGVMARLVRINQACRKAGIAVFYPQADHRPDLRDFTSRVVDLDHAGMPGEPRPRMSKPPEVSAAGAAREVVAELAPQPADYVIKKHRWSSFFQTHLELSLRTAGIDTLMLAGGAVEVGIASTAYSARDLDFNLVILRDACLSPRPDVEEIYMERVFPIFARVLTVDEAIALIAG